MSIILLATVGVLTCFGIAASFIIIAILPKAAAADRTAADIAKLESLRRIDR